jgi:hypothetical protein
MRGKRDNLLQSPAMRPLYVVALLAALTLTCIGTALPFNGILNEGLVPGSENWFDLTDLILLVAGPLTIVAGLREISRR